MYKRRYHLGVKKENTDGNRMNATLKAYRNPATHFAVASP